MKHIKLLSILVLSLTFSSISVSLLAETQTEPEECIDDGLQITTAKLFIKNQYPNSRNLRISQIIAADEQSTWDESTVTWDTFFNVDMFSTLLPSIGDITVNNSDAGYSTHTSEALTALVDGWINGDLVNHGLLIEDSPANLDAAIQNIFSSESELDNRPKLVITFDDNTQIVIQRSAESGVVYDAWLDGNTIDNSKGRDTILRTLVDIKEIIIRFDLPVYCEPPPGPGVGTPGYWKNHEWPDIDLTFGGYTYEADDLLRFMKHNKKKGNKAIDMIKHLAAATFNVATGNDDSCISSSIADANDWLSAYATPIDSVFIAADGTEWQNDGEAIKNQLDDYNNGLLCAASRD